MSDLPAKLRIHFDGACEPKNPGGWATYGFVITDSADGTVIKAQGGLAYKQGHKMATNNCAEYAALGFALKFLEEEKWKGTLEIFGDSKLVVEQVNDNWACNKDHLQILRERVWSLLKAVGEQWTIAWVPREENEAADTLSRSAYEEATGLKFPERRKK